ncbi:hypothetical protein ACLOJK_028352 [Asimina triloba]
MAAIEYRGLNAVTNFDLSRYIKWLRPSPQNPTPDPISDAQNPNPSAIHDIGFEFLRQTDSGDVAPPLRPSAAGGGASSALGLLLQSSKFKEMLEMTSAADCPSTPPESENPPRCSFPEDIQTYFECQEENSEGVDDVIFGDLNSYAAVPMFQCELEEAE